METKNSQGKNHSTTGTGPGLGAATHGRIQEDQGEVQEQDQGGETPIFPRDSLGRESGGPIELDTLILSTTRKSGAATWATVQNASGEWTGSRKETAEALIRKYFPEDDAKINTAGNRETREAQGRPKRKASGIDGFPIAGFQHLLEFAGREMPEVMNSCLREGRFPEIWKEAEVTWLSKPNGGLRPVCLLPTIGKICDKIFPTRLAYFLESEGKISNRQFGSRKGRGHDRSYRGSRERDQEGRRRKKPLFNGRARHQKRIQFGLAS